MRVGIFGGTFDPIHIGHLILAESCREACQLDRVLFVIAGEPPHKGKPRTSAKHRLEMVELAIAGEERFVLNTSEVERQGPSYTVDTVRELQSHFASAQVFLLIGQDQYAGLPTWHEWRELLSRVTLATAVGPAAYENFFA